MIDAFTELMPGVAWSNEMKNELYTHLVDEGSWDAEVQVEGFAKVHAVLTRYGTSHKKQMTYKLEATVLCYTGISDLAGHPAKREWFPDNPDGVVKAFEFLKEGVNFVKRRGFCQHCLQRPRKRIRLSLTENCSECTMKHMSQRLRERIRLHLTENCGECTMKHMLTSV